MVSILSNIDPNYWSSLVSSPWVIFINLIDITIVAYLIYRFIKAVAGTKVMTLIQGVIFFMLTRTLTEWLGFTTLAYLMNQVITYGVIAGVIIFAPEIRGGLEKFGRATNVFMGTQSRNRESGLVEALVKSAAYMSPRKIGALIAIERTQTLREYQSTGITMGAAVSSQLLINIFIPNTPLHDGAVIISGDKIESACSYLPLSESQAISKEFGTRHRAAIGLSEHSDAVTIVISEETGAISLAYKDNFIHDLTLDDFRKYLNELLIEEDASEPFWQKFLGRKKS